MRNPLRPLDAKVLKQAALGRRSDQIAAAVGTSRPNVSLRLGLIGKALGSGKRPALVHRALVHGWLLPLPPSQCPAEPVKLDGMDQRLRQWAAGMVHEDIHETTGIPLAKLRGEATAWMRHLGARNRAHMVYLAWSWGWLDADAAPAPPPVGLPGNNRNKLLPIPGANGTPAPEPKEVSR